MCLQTLATLEVTPTPVQMMCCHSDRRCGTWAPFIVAVLFSSASAGLMMPVACPAASSGTWARRNGAREHALELKPGVCSDERTPEYTCKHLLGCVKSTTVR